MDQVILPGDAGNNNTVSSENEEDDIPLIKPSESYDVDSKTTQVLIINNDTFKKNLNVENLPKSLQEAENFKRVLIKFGVLENNIMLKNNLTNGEMAKVIKSFAKNILKNCSLVIVVVLSHGAQNGLIYATDGIIDFKTNVMDKFLGDNCPNLIGKPKIFIPEVCRGRKFERSCSVNDIQSRAGPFVQDVFSLPFNSDVLLCYPTSENTVTYVGGFLKHLTHAIDKFIVREKCNYDIAQILTTVCNHVCNLSFEGNKIVPTYQSTLRRQLHLTKHEGVKKCNTGSQTDTFFKEFFILHDFVLVLLGILLFEVLNNYFRAY